MWNAFLTKVGFFLLSKGAQMLLKRFFGKEIQKHLEALIIDLSTDDTLTGKQKYNRAKKFLDATSVDMPEPMKNLIIEALVSKVKKIQ